ncbi:hypothetical protein HW555_010684 [Spodoptera exigua]|uniref:Uncharacterized protein n=1 Tax=Spodoptera exigua TaxID=7107 RepID=A0A835GA08_SPOEX|nr:hypothetical protein HW555_010684 [Spodoptera exigua]
MHSDYLNHVLCLDRVYFFIRTSLQRPRVPKHLDQGAEDQAVQTASLSPWKKDVHGMHNMRGNAGKILPRPRWNWWRLQVATPIPRMPHLMAIVITKLKNVTEEPSIEEYRQINDNLEAQIASCIERLGPEYVVSGGDDDIEPDDVNTRKRKHSCEWNSDEAGLRPSGKRLPDRWISAADLAEAGPSVKVTHELPPNPAPCTSLLTTLPIHSPQSSPLQQETISELDPPLLFIEQLELPASPVLPATPPQLEAMTADDVALLFSQDDLLDIYGAVDSVDQVF